MIVTYKEIKKIKFPVFILPNSNWELVDGLLLIDNQVVDDKNMPGASLGIRRLQTHFTEHPCPRFKGTQLICGRGRCTKW